MFSVANLKGMQEILLVVKIAQHECGTTMFNNTCKKLQRSLYVRSFAFRVKVEHFAYDIKDVFTSFLRRDILLDMVGKEYHSYLIIILNGAKSNGGSYFCHHIALHLALRAEVERSADVYE